MKIYPSNHKIKAVTESRVDTDLNIPLGYIDVDYSKYKVDKLPSEYFSTDSMTPLIPGQELENGRVKIFNRFKEEVNTTNLMQYTNQKWYYMPDNIIKYTPKFFLWKAMVKKNMSYCIDTVYNININCYNAYMSNKLSPVFTGASSNGYVPSNIRINNNQLTADTFMNMPVENSDFCFIATANAAYYDDECTKPIDVYEYFEKGCNLWIACEDARSFNESYEMLSSIDNVTYRLNSPIINSNSSIMCDTYFNLNRIVATSGVNIHNIFDKDGNSPILILEYVNGGFVIISHTSLFDDSHQTAGFPIVFETLMYVFMNSYKSTDYIKEWITYRVPDYEVIGNTLATKNNFTSNTNLSTYFGINSKDMSLVNISIIDDFNTRSAVSDEDLDYSTNAIKCIGQNNNRLMFELDPDIDIDGYTEPERPNGWKSMYYNGQIYYLSVLHYLIETDLTNNIYMIEDENDLKVLIYAFKSSSLGINVTKSTTVTISYIIADIDSGETIVQRVREANYSVYYDKTDDSISYCFAEDYVEKDNQYLLFTISISQTSDAITIYDIRQSGGGLPENEPDNYNLFDIGHINGRPYRQAGTLVITLPSKYKEYEERIMNVVKKYMVAEDYPVIFFEDEEV